jgi:hypothetical protein
LYREIAIVKKLLLLDEKESHVVRDLRRMRKLYARSLSFNQAKRTCELKPFAFLPLLSRAIVLMQIEHK